MFTFSNVVQLWTWKKTFRYKQILKHLIGMYEHIISNTPTLATRYTVYCPWPLNQQLTIASQILSTRTHNLCAMWIIYTWYVQHIINCVCGAVGYVINYPTILKLQSKTSYCCDMESEWNLCVVDGNFCVADQFVWCLVRHNWTRSRVEYLSPTLLQPTKCQSQIRTAWKNSHFRNGKKPHT